MNTLYSVYSTIVQLPWPIISLNVSSSLPPEDFYICSSLCQEHTPPGLSCTNSPLQGSLCWMRVYSTLCVARRTAWQLLLLFVACSFSVSSPLSSPQGCRAPRSPSSRESSCKPWGLGEHRWVNFEVYTMNCTVLSLLSNATILGGVVLGGSVGKESPSIAGDTGNAGSIPGSGRSSGGGHNNPVQYSCLENPMDRGAWGQQRVRHDWSSCAPMQILGEDVSGGRAVAGVWSAMELNPGQEMDERSAGRKTWRLLWAGPCGAWEPARLWGESQAEHGGDASPVSSQLCVPGYIILSHLT